ncbi:TPA: hypothetical protein DD394_01150 [bacterium UBP9_UBA11836]|nr:hypothetical protein [bacterium UBP9_UBA11836]
MTYKKICHTLCLTLAIVTIFFCSVCNAKASAQAEEQQALATFEHFLKLGGQGDPSAWNLLSAEGQKIALEIVAQGYIEEMAENNAEEAGQIDIDELIEKLRGEMENPDSEIARMLWEGLKEDIATLDNGKTASTWKAKIEGNKAFLTPPDGDDPMQMVKENGQWKVGIFETLRQIGIL